MPKPPPPIAREALLAAVRSAVGAAGGRPITMSAFVRSSGVKVRDINRHFATWNQLLQAAGFDFEPYNARLDEKAMLADWGEVTRKLRHMPSRCEYEIHGKYGAGTFYDRFERWSTIHEAFRAFAGRAAKWKDVIGLLPAPGAGPVRCGGVRGGTRIAAGRAGSEPAARKRIPRRLSRTRSKLNPPPRSTGRPLCGKLLEIGGMRNAPLNEMGVVFLFAILADKLGFHIESLQVAFPDCEAKRRMGPEVWQQVRIEFEFESREFRRHGHAVDGCDIIVCWVHNWADCPGTLEVIELSEVVKRLAPGEAPE